MGAKQALLKTEYIELDPVFDGFEGVLLELTYNGHRYVLTETAVGSGNVVFQFASANYRLVHEIFRLHTAAASDECSLIAHYPILVW